MLPPFVPVNYSANLVSPLCCFFSFYFSNCDLLPTILSFHMYVLELASAATKKAVVPRQLDFSRNPSRTSITGKPQNFRASINVSHQPRIRLSGIMKQDVSVMDGISLLSQTISENPDDVTVQVS